MHSIGQEKTQVAADSLVFLNHVCDGAYTRQNVFPGFVLIHRSYCFDVRPTPSFDRSAHNGILQRIKSQFFPLRPIHSKTMLAAKDGVRFVRTVIPDQSGEAVTTEVGIDKAEM